MIGNPTEKMIKFVQMFKNDNPHFIKLDGPQSTYITIEEILFQVPHFGSRREIREKLKDGAFKFGCYPEHYNGIMWTKLEPGERIFKFDFPFLLCKGATSMTNLVFVDLHTNSRFFIKNLKNHPQNLKSPTKKTKSTKKTSTDSAKV